VAVEPTSLGPEAGALFAAFRCTVFRQRWTRDIEDTIRETLATELAINPQTQALGYVVDGKLVSLVVWRPLPDEQDVWQIQLLATATGSARRGYAERLKRELLNRANAADILIVQSEVHRDNTGMLQLNRKLGATISPVPGNPDYLVCMIDPATSIWA